MGMSDRILVMRGGTVVAEFTRAEASQEAIAAAMMSAADEAAPVAVNG
jgi:ABC-type sugar transport system ATPase subunit